MKKFRVVSVLFLGLSVGLTGCFKTTRLVQKTLAPEMFRSAGVETLQKALSARNEAIQTLNASVLITLTTGGGEEGKVTEYTSFRGYIFVRKPRNLRVIMQLPLIGSEAMEMVSNATDFTLVVPPYKKAWTGTSTAAAPEKDALSDPPLSRSAPGRTPSRSMLETLRPAVFFDSLLVPGVGPDEFVAVNQSTRLVKLPSHNEEMEEPDYDIAVMKQKNGKVLQTMRVIHINRINMLPYQQDVYDDRGQVVTLTTYDKYQDYNGQQFPAVVTIKRPLDEYSLKVEITKLTLNGKLEDDQFELKVPEGYLVQKMQ